MNCQPNVSNCQLDIAQNMGRVDTSLPVGLGVEKLNSSAHVDPDQADIRRMADVRRAPGCMDAGLAGIDHLHIEQMGGGDALKIGVGEGGHPGVSVGRTPMLGERENFSQISEKPGLDRCELFPYRAGVGGSCGNRGTASLYGDARCPTCRDRVTWEAHKPLVYIITDGEFFKIGITSCIKSRMSVIRGGNPRLITILFTAECEFPKVVEGVLHRFFSHRNVRGEWFSFSPAELNEARAILEAHSLFLPSSYNQQLPKGEA